MSKTQLKILPLILTGFLILELLYIYLYKQPNNPGFHTNLNVKSQSAVYNQNSSSVNLWITSYLASFGKNILTSSVVTSNFKGKIVKVFNSPGVQNTIKYEKGLLLSNISGPATENYYFLRSEDMSKVSVYDISGGRTKINFSDLKVGDNVNIIEQMDILSTPSVNRISVEIDRI